MSKGTFLHLSCRFAKVATTVHNRVLPTDQTAVFGLQPCTNDAVYRISVLIDTSVGASRPVVATLQP